MKTEVSHRIIILQLKRITTGHLNQTKGNLKSEGPVQVFLVKMMFTMRHHLDTMYIFLQLSAVLLFIYVFNSFLSLVLLLFCTLSLQFMIGIQ